MAWHRGGDDDQADRTGQRRESGHDVRGGGRRPVVDAPDGTVMELVRLVIGIEMTEQGVESAALPRISAAARFDAYEQQPVAVRAWLDEDYPAIRGQMCTANRRRPRVGAETGPEAVGGTVRHVEGRWTWSSCRTTVRSST